jgi:hypothetical protein
MTAFYYYHMESGRVLISLFRDASSFLLLLTENYSITTNDPTTERTEDAQRLLKRNLPGSPQHRYPCGAVGSNARLPLDHGCLARLPAALVAVARGPGRPQVAAQSSGRAGLPGKRSCRAGGRSGLESRWNWSILGGFPCVWILWKDIVAAMQPSGSKL